MLNKETIVNLLATNDKAVARALVVLNEHQTADEQVQETVKYQNGEGFRPCHARMGTSMAQFYLKRGYLSPKQVAYWRKLDAKGNMRIAIYWRQLIAAAEAKAAATGAANNGLVKVNGEFERPVATKPVADVGNMQEELMVLEEQYSDYQDSDDFPALERMQEKMAMLRKEISRAYAEA